jgi:hypothetical protein
LEENEISFYGKKSIDTFLNKIKETFGDMEIGAEILK